MTRGTLVIFAKEPVAGRVKTRLGKDIGMPAAAWWFRHQTARLLRRVGHDPRWATVLAIAPDQAIVSRAWSPYLPRWPQGPGDLGQRMARAFRQMPNGPVIIVGADIPGITSSRIADAFRALREADAVIGPATDGGYWLIGFRNAGVMPSSLFHGVRWSTRHAMEDTLTSMPGLRVARAATLSDVDTAQDL
ncbi:MAG: TIGR04282 family arsenosugar biosynthesis glycosyltransferase [Pseudomonadota bacterium]